MKILAFDTATTACTVALECDGQPLARFEVAPRQHGALLLPMIESLLSEAGCHLSSLDAIAFGQGPGMFTGVRIAAGAAQGLSYALKIPVIPISTLTTLAQDMHDTYGVSGCLAALDARMGEIYWAEYQTDHDGLMIPMTDEQLSPPESITASDTALMGGGSGWDEYHKQLGHLNLPWQTQRFPSATSMLKLAQKAFKSGQYVAPHAALPVYLRKAV